MWRTSFSQEAAADACVLHHRKGGVQFLGSSDGKAGKHVACGLGWATEQIKGGSKGHAGGFWTHVLYRRVRERKPGDEIKGN